MTVISHTVDEETPLVTNDHVVVERTPLPWFQFSVVLFIYMSKPLTSRTIHPFVPELIRNIGITNGHEKKVGYYVGLLESIHYLGEASTVFQWNRLSDRIGRKPVLLIGLMGLSISMYSFGLSTTFLGLALCQCLNGALNGNVGVIKSVIAELTDTTNIAKAYACAPLVFDIGAALGPLIGGSLSRPSDQFPRLFGSNSFLKQYPYFLPCAISATVAACSWLITLIYLKETVKHPIPLSRLVSTRKPTLHTTNSSEIVLETNEEPLPFRAVMTRKVLIAAGNYAMLSLVNIAFHAIRPVFYSAAITDGGLNLSPPAIGFILSMYSLLHGLVQVFFFAGIHNRWGSKNAFSLAILTFLPIFALFPVMNWLARRDGVRFLVWLALGIQLGVSILIPIAHAAIFIIIADASPNRASLGATNGFCQTTVSVMRAIGPAAANSLYSFSMEKGYLGGNLVYYVLIGVVAMAYWLALLLPSDRNRRRNRAIK